MNAPMKILSALLARDDYLESVTEVEFAAFLEILDASNTEILGKIAQANEWNSETLARIKAEIDEIYLVATQKIQRVLDSDMPGLASSELLFIGDTFSQAIPGIALVNPTALNLWASIKALPAVPGSTLANLLDGMKLSMSADVVEQIQLSVAESEGLPELVTRLRGAALRPAHWAMIEGKRTYIPGQYKGGVMTVDTRQAEMIGRTAIMHIGTQAREMYYQANADLIKGFMRVETLDIATCIPCGVEDGRMYGVNEPRPQLPAHPSCRGLWLPILKSFRELGVNADELPETTRASMDGQVPAHETWTDRLAAASPDRRIAMLGVSRAKLYEGGMNLSQMVKDGKLVPLKELGK